LHRDESPGGLSPLLTEGKDIMGESTSTYQVADLVAEMAEATQRQRPELLEWTIAQLTPLRDGISAQELNWAADPDELDARFGAVFLDLMFTHLGARRFDEPLCALGRRLTRDEYGNVSARAAGQQTLTGTASNLITAAWFVVSGIDYAATTFVFHRNNTNRCLRLATDGGTCGRERVLDTARIAAHSTWARTITSGRRASWWWPWGGAA
jgi:hypothetical protein